MKRALILILLFLADLAPASAEIRVLFRFDENGHEVHRVVDLGARQPFKGMQSGQRTPLHGLKLLPGREVSRSESDSGLVTIVWWDVNGARISTTEAPDPRISRSPAHIVGSSSQFVVLKSGGWMVTGPGNSVAVSVFFASYAELGLGESQWRADLSQY